MKSYARRLFNMLPESDKTRFHHMLVAAEEAIAFLRNRSRNDLDNDRQLQLALMRCLEIIGEAASRMSEETRSNNPGIPWSRMVGARNRLIHVYFDVDLDIVWKTVSEELPALICEIKVVVNA